MTPEELRRRQKIIDDADSAAYACAGCLMMLVDRGFVTQPTALKAVRKFREATTDYYVTNAIDRAKEKSTGT